MTTRSYVDRIPKRCRHQREEPGEDKCKFEPLTKAAALRVSPCVVCIVTPVVGEEEAGPRCARESIYWRSGVIIECQRAADGTYVSTILTNAAIFARANGAQLNEIEIEVYLLESKVYTGEVVACDFHFNLAVVRIVSDTPLQTAKLKELDDIISVDLTEQFRLHDEKPFQLRRHSNLCKILPGDQVTALARFFTNPYSLLTASGAFSLESSRFGGNESYYVKGIDSEGFQGGPVINYSGEVIGIMSGKGAFLPINIVSRWWVHYKNYREFCRPWIGFRVANLHEAPVQFLEQFTRNFRDVSTGIVVTYVEQDSPASCAGICPLDVIVQCDGAVVRSRLELFGEIMDKTEKSVEFRVLRASNGVCLNPTLIIGKTLPNKLYSWAFPYGYPRKGVYMPIV